MIVILDYGMGNSGSILNMLRKVGGSAIISRKKEDLLKANGIIIPGVGRFDSAMKMLQDFDLIDPLNRIKSEGVVPILGICLGMQLFFKYSSEGCENGLGWIDGEVKKFNFSSCEKGHNLKVPHMGWNSISVNESQNIFKDLDFESRFYFVHSYYVFCTNSKNILAEANYGGIFTCAVCDNNLYGVQFHPEKSHSFGMKLFKNFLEIVDFAKN
jgi:imidazole glycerol-phosphate synthase subunit HisH